MSFQARKDIKERLEFLLLGSKKKPGRACDKMSWLDLAALGARNATPVAPESRPHSEVALQMEIHMTSARLPADVVALLASLASRRRAPSNLLARRPLPDEFVSPDCCGGDIVGSGGSCCFVCWQHLPKVSLLCGHLLCVTCYRRWLAEAERSCWMCRARVEGAHQVFLDLGETPRTTARRNRSAPSLRSSKPGEMA
jgi:hypothetical protein